MNSTFDMGKILFGDFGITLPDIAKSLSCKRNKILVLSTVLIENFALVAL